VYACNKYPKCRTSAKKVRGSLKEILEEENEEK